MNLRCATMALLTCLYLSQLPPNKPALPTIRLEGHAGRESVHEFSKLLGKKSLADLEALCCHSNDTIAIHAAWQRVRVMCRRDSSGAAVDPRAIEYFLGFLSGRLGIRIPKWWQWSIRLVRKLQIRGRYHLVPGAARGYRLTFPTVRIEGKPVSVAIAPGPKIREAQDTLWLVSSEKPKPINLGPALLRSGFDFCTVDALALPQGTAIVFAPRDAASFQVVCVDSSGGTVWRVSGWGNGLSHPGILVEEDRVTRIELVSSRNRLYVFGVAKDIAAFIEVFESTTGRPRIRFSTEYFWEKRGASARPPMQ